MTELRTAAGRHRWLWIAAAWGAGALFDASQTVIVMRVVEGRQHSWLPLFAIELALWLPWALATPVIVGLARRWPLVRGVDVRAIVVHLAAFALVSAIVETWSASWQVLFNPWANNRWPTFVDTWTTSLVFQLFTFAIAYALILTVTYLVDARDRIARQMTEAARLNEELSRAQLTALLRQLEPHFMYNTLNTIAGLVRDERNLAAVNMIVGLSEFLRRATEDSHKTQVTLAEEVEYLQRYLDIQTLRFGDRLRASVDIPDDLLHAKVPNLLLQPLVENAIKHGISRRVSGGTIRIVGTADGNTLRLRVSNDGPCTQEDLDATRTGVGLGNLRTRLQILHGGAADLVLQRAGADGVDVVVTLPLQVA
ncbi:MAG TPA: histidine kinase [Tahibacter sp.]|nr:histidine kinase [Tahibacter sp.]